MVLKNDIFNQACRTVYKRFSKHCFCLWKTFVSEKDWNCCINTLHTGNTIYILLETTKGRLINGIAIYHRIDDKGFNSSQWNKQL